MSKLRSHDLSFEFRYTGFEHGWVQYQLSFLWKGEPVIRDGALKRGSSYWDGRSESTFLANEDEKDGMIPLIRGVLETDKEDYWQPIEPDIIIAIYPDNFFPFMESHMKLVYERDEVREAREARQALKAQMVKLPDDIFTFIAFVDAYNFRGADAYYGQGFSMHMIVRRKELENFASDLESEYRAFKDAFGVDEWLKENQ